MPSINSRLIYQGALFFNSTLLYTLAVRCFGSSDLLLFSAVIAALSLVSNLAVQLPAFQFNKFIYLVKGASIALLAWIYFRTKITPQMISLLIGVAAVIATNRNALLGIPSLRMQAAVFLPIFLNLILIGLVWFEKFDIEIDFILIILMLPYLLTALVSFKFETNIISSSSEEKCQSVGALVFSQLLPAASAFVMLTFLSVEMDERNIANFVMLERAIAIGGSVVYFYARVKGSIRPMNGFVFIGFLVVVFVLIISAISDVYNLFVLFFYFLSGCLLSYSTVALGAKYAKGILVINGVAFLTVLVVSFHLFGFDTVNIIAFYIVPQLILASGLVFFSLNSHD